MEWIQLIGPAKMGSWVFIHGNTNELVQCMITVMSSPSQLLHPLIRQA